MPSTQVELSIRCEDLLDEDLTSKSDPTCVLFVQNGGSWSEFGRTEQIKDTHHPRWETKFVLDYRFEERQLLKLAVYDIDSDQSELGDHDFLGNTECSLGEIMAAQSKGFMRNLSKGGKIFVHAEELSSNRDTVTLRFVGKELDKKDFFGKSDPFFEISRANESNDFSIVYRSEVIQNTLNPSWKQFSIESRTLCNGDHDRTLKFDVYDSDDDGSHDLIGSFQTNLRKLLAGSGTENRYECINEKKKKKKGAKYRKKFSGI